MLFLFANAFDCSAISGQPQNQDKKLSGYVKSNVAGYTYELKAFAILTY